jgi:hypothetical protein
MNGDSTIRHHLCPPDLISEPYKNYEGRVGQENARLSRNFIQPDFMESNSKTFVLWIGFNFDWYEVRDLDLKTGLFGRCRRSGRQ